jgi:hypothetical protein
MQAPNEAKTDTDPLLANRTVRTLLGFGSSTLYNVANIILLYSTSTGRGATDPS